jgi:membrane-associated protease RseP (regulator of RpoE activity)
MQERPDKIEYQPPQGRFVWPLYKPFIKKPPRTSINLVLFILTFGTTWLMGILEYISYRFSEIPSANPQQLIMLTLKNPSLILDGLYFSVAIMFFLLAHEGGHYLACRYYNIDATLPYFIPAPTLVGTFGAFIKIRAPITNKKVLFDIGIAGPLAGFIVSLPTMIYGIMMSKSLPPAEMAEGMYLHLGDPLIFKLLQKLLLPSIPANYDLLLHPLAFVGWFGCLATCLNLFPVSQLDGGHIAYSIFGSQYSKISKFIFFGIIGMGVLSGYYGWFFWALILFFLGFRHPPTLNDELELGRGRKILAFVAFLLLILTFTPKPIYIS